MVHPIAAHRVRARFSGGPGCVTGLGRGRDWAWCSWRPPGCEPREARMAIRSEAAGDLFRTPGSGALPATAW